MDRHRTVEKRQDAEGHRDRERDREKLEEEGAPYFHGPDPIV